MLPGGLDPSYRQALATSHDEYVLVEVLDGAGNVLPIPADRTSDEGGLIFLGGTVSATLTNRVARRLEIMFDEALYPITATSILAPYGNRLRVWRGIAFADGTTYRWIVFTGRIQGAVNGLDGQVSVSAMDRGNEVVEAKFLRPTNSNTGQNVYVQFQDLILGGVADAQFGTSDSYTQVMPQLAWESDRAGAADEIATSVGSFWYTLAPGQFVLRRYPYTVASPSILTLDQGDGGILAASPGRARETIYNSITVTGERADGSAPVYGLAQDLNPDSPTYVNGNFGLRHQTIRLQTVRTQGEATSAAQDYLARSISLAETWTWIQPVDAALELGDVVTLNARNESGIIQVVSSFVLPLAPGAFMAVSGQAQVLPILEDA